METELRIGVFVCHCGINIAGVLDIEDLCDYAGTLPNVATVQPNLFTCAETGTSEIKKAVKEHDLNRVVVAACTPRTHEPIFRASCQEAGIDPYFFEMVNIREHCSWVHRQDKGAAQAKARDLIRMAVAKAVFLEPIETFKSKIEPRALVIGAGITGMSSALALAGEGFEVILLEKEAELGGLLRHLHKIAPSEVSAAELIGEKMAAIQKDNRIKCFTSATVDEVSGYVGNYTVRFSCGDESHTHKVGAIIVATGGTPLKPTGLYNYDGKRVITQSELETKLKSGKMGAKNIVMIQCVGARIPERNYCSRICCMVAIKNCLHIKEVVKDAKVFVLYRDIQAYGVENEALFLKAKEAGVRFIRYNLESPPVVEEATVRIYHSAMGKEVPLPADLVVLSTPIVANDDSESLSRTLKVPVNEYGFFLEAHAKLSPLDFATSGMYLCGNAHYPATVREAISQALGAASRASMILSHEAIERVGTVARVDQELCSSCFACVKVCPYQVPRMDETGKATIEPMQCQGCGICVAECPAEAIQFGYISDEQIMAACEALCA
ncbi:MAG TPA: CoB--CoM heterodisulfide reductase iron-sulfur subunit A family protein [Desulfobacterales bacterium]|nr:CoB--CoM heterodisulfide reductase iron-sulfur subunit A family protein [Desulfobacterales bacterium]